MFTSLHWADEVSVQRDWQTAIQVVSDDSTEGCDHHLCTANSEGELPLVIEPVKRLWSGATMRAERIRIEIERLAQADLWPGFDCLAVPIAIFDGFETVLFNHPDRPTEFVATGSSRILSYSGLHPAVRANTVITLDGIPTATVMLADGGHQSAARQAALAIHETFHVFQQERHPTWVANEADLFSYPTDVPSLVALSRLEVLALAHALSGTGNWVGWALTAVRLRGERFAGTRAEAVAYERSTELVEGLAHYVELRALGKSPSLDASSGFVVDARERMYLTGAAMALLLDHLAPRWRDALEHDADSSLDALLESVLSDRPERPEAISRGEHDRAHAAAEADVTDLVARRRARRATFLDQPGGQLIVVAAYDNPLWPRGFDPMNVVIVGPGEVLHERYLALGNAAAEIELLDCPALTVAVGQHVLFDGVGRLLVTGLDHVPTVHTADGRSVIKGPGCRGEFTAARIERSSSSLTLHLTAL